MGILVYICFKADRLRRAAIVGHTNGSSIGMRSKRGALRCVQQLMSSHACRQRGGGGPAREANGSGRL
jgi:hypothetical protein